ncbi:MAG: hypothetical protein AMXMBFR33_36660 [Candidatus Xenobia bacterium]
MTQQTQPAGKIEKVGKGSDSGGAVRVGDRASQRAAGGASAASENSATESVELSAVQSPRPDPAANQSAPWRPAEPADLLGLHLLSAYPENGTAEQQEGWQAATGGGFVTEAASMNSMTNPNDPSAMRRREQLLTGMLQAQQNGRQVNMRLDYDWGRNVPDTPEGRAEYARMVSDFVQEARARGVDLSRVNFVLGNEPNLALENQNKGMSPEDYVAAVQAVREELERRGIDARLASAGLSPGGSDMGQYFTRMLQAGLGDLVDVYAMHEYQDSLHNIDNLHQIASGFGQAKPIEITEFGIPRGGNLNAQQQAAAYQSFIRRVMDWNADPSRPPIQSVSLWIHNRGPGQEGYLVSPEMLQAMNELSHSKYRGQGKVDLGPPPAPQGPPSSGGSSASGQASAASQDQLMAASSFSEDQLMALAMTALQELQLGQPGPATRLLLQLAPGLQGLSEVTRRLVAAVLGMAGASGLSEGSGSQGSSSDSSPPGVPPQAAPVAPVGPIPQAFDPTAAFNPASVLSNSDPSRPPGGPGIEVRFLDAQGNPVDARGLVVRYDGGGEPYYYQTENKPESGPSYVYIPVFPQGYSGQYNVTPGRMENGQFVSVGPAAKIEITREHRLGEVRFQQSSPAPKPAAQEGKPAKEPTGVTRSG